jgi:hypothetical protein
VHGMQCELDLREHGADGDHRDILAQLQIR